MTFSRVVVLALLAVAASADASPQQPRRPARDVSRTPEGTTAPATAAIRGRITTADGQPIRRAEVSALSSGADLRTALTDEEGRFQLTALAAGSWFLSVRKNGYLTQPLGARTAFDTAAAVAVADGQQFTVDVAMTRAAAIAGRVYDEYGEPLTGVRISVMRSRMADRRRYLQPVGDGDTTDDTGAFRIYGLPPGEYYVGGSLRVAPPDSVVQTTHSPTYYPGTASFAEAQRVLLSAGAEAVVDFPLLPFRTARISGTVVTSSGAPANAFLNLTSEAAELGTPLGFGGVTRDDGGFTLADVPPGSYTLAASLRDGASVDSELGAVPVVVYGDDVSGLTIATSPPGSLQGTIVAAPGAARRVPGDVAIVARSTRVSGDATFATVEDGTFELKAPLGPFQLQIEPPDGWGLVSVTVRDAEATDGPIDIGSEQKVPVRVVLTDRLTEVTGTIVGGDAARPPSVVVFAEDSGRWTPFSRHLRTVAVDEDGQFRVTGLPPGARYLAVAVDVLEPGEGEDPDFLRRVRDLAVTFDLSDGEKRIIAVPLTRR